MAVTITTKFYDGSTWKDLSKIVFTSPNMDSPNTAGTRSHIFPGGAIPLGMWYEDVSNMYRIEDEQETDSSTYFGYSAQLYDSFDLDDPALYITLSGTDQDDWIEYIRERVDINNNSFPMQFTAVADEADYTYLSFTGCSYSASSSQSGHPAEEVVTTSGWLSDGVCPQWVEIAFPSKRVVNYLSFDDSAYIRNVAAEIDSFSGSEEDAPLHPFSAIIGAIGWATTSGVPPQYVDMVFDEMCLTEQIRFSRASSPTAALIKGFRFQGKVNPGDSYTTLISGTHPDDAGYHDYSFSNSTFYKYYRLIVDSTYGPNLIGVKNLYIYGYIGSDSSIENFRFQAKNPGDSYTTLVSGTHILNTLEEETFSNLVPYSHYKLLADSTHAIYAGADELKMKGWTYNNEYTASSGTEIAFKAFADEGWYIDADGTEPHWVTVGFSSPKRITKVTFQNYDGYNFKYYKFQACNTISGTYTDLYSSWASFDPDAVHTITFSNYLGYNYYRMYIYSKYASAAGYGLRNCKMYEYAVDESVTDPVTLYFDSDNTVDISHANNALTTDYLFKLDVDSVTGSGIISSGSYIYGWGWPGGSSPEVETSNSIVFELTNGECYDCRLTAWDDATHSTTSNEIISGDHCRVSALAFNSTGTVLSPTEYSGVSFIYPPVLNRIFKGNTVYEGTPYYYGDFDLRYRTGSVLGDYLIFKPMLYGIHSGISYGVHDFLITLHYSYT